LPELPEVETIVRSIASHLLGQTILHAAVSSHRVTRGSWARTVKRLTGASIRGVLRRGKQIYFELDRGVLYIHLGMTGKLLWRAEGVKDNARSKYLRASLDFDSGTLLYEDVRQFGRFEFFAEMPEHFERAGPDALSVTFAEFFERLKRRKGHIKPLLLNQSFIAGVGNIYADESLFAARVNPRTQAGRISQKRAEELHRRIVEILELAIHHRGSSISDYVDAAGARGSFQLQHNVYGRAGEPCPRCGHSIRRILLGQRGTHYCPRCQRT
jgi:formamidopyrimidine-DNA glycosylase